MTNTTATTNGAIRVEDLKRVDVSSSVFEASLTPDQCRHILRSSTNNDINFRKLAEDTRLAALVDAMKRNQWVWTDADPIRLHVHPGTGDVVCTDGQHRLLAASKARRNLRTLVLFGEEWAAGMHVDRNKNRSTAQFLTHEHGLVSASVYVALVRMHLARIVAVEENLAVNYATIMMPDEAIVAHVLANLNELGWAIGKQGTGNSRGFNSTGYGCFMYELLQVSHETASKFHDDLKDNDLDATDPLYQLRRVVSRQFGETGLRMNRAFTIANLVKCHNMRAVGQTVTKWHQAQQNEVTFPAGFKPKK